MISDWYVPWKTPTLRPAVEIDLSTQELDRMSAEIIRAQERECQRIAANLHDDPIQILAGLQMRLGVLARRSEDRDLQEEIRESEEMVSHCIGRLRNLVFELHPRALANDEGLRPALQQLVRNAAAETGTRTILNDSTSAPPEELTRVVIYRVALEALANVRKHAQARRIQLTLEERAGGYLLQVRDDGKGFAPEQHVGSDHVGLLSMRERAESAGGWLRVESGAGEGTTVEMWVPAQGAPEPTDRRRPRSLETARPRPRRDPTTWPARRSETGSRPRRGS
jgi:signal transduction histidine kinase